MRESIELKQPERQLKIAFISNYRPDGQQSMSRYASMVCGFARAAGFNAEILSPPVILGNVRIGTALIRKWIGYLDKFLLAPLYLRWKTRNADVVHVCDHSNAMYLPWVGECRQVITCHDLLAVLSAKGRFPDVKVGITGRILQHWISTSLARAESVVCVSRKTEKDLLQLVPAMAQATRVIHHPLNRRLSPVPRWMVDKILDQFGIQPTTQYLLHVGGNQWYKNRIGALKIWKELSMRPGFQSMKLIMVGKPWTQAMRDFCVSSGLQTSVVEAVDVSDDGLCTLYSGAEALLFPSHEEGFGWPILEAQACCCAVITNNKPPMTEVAGDGAIFVDPDQPQTAAQTILEQWPQRNLLIGKGLMNLERFSEASAIEAYTQLYRDLTNPLRTREDRPLGQFVQE